MLRLLAALLPTLFSAMRSRRHLVIENLALRQQLATFASRLHPDVRPSDRVFWVLLRGVWSGWAEVLAIVRPDTVVRWHRAGFRPQRKPNASRGRQGLAVRSSGRAEARPNSQRRQPSPGRWPASPLCLAPGGVSRFGPEVHLNLAAGSIGGGGSCARGPKVTSIRESGTTIEAPSPSSGALLHRASHALLFTDRVLATHRSRSLTGPSREILGHMEGTWRAEKEKPPGEPGG